MKSCPLMLAALVAGLSAGCASGAQRLANVRLRNANTQFQSQIETLTRQVYEREGQIAVLSKMHPDRVDQALVPQVAAISIKSGSGLDPSPNSDVPALQILVQSVDGRNRPIQLAGTLEVQVLNPRPDAAPELVASTKLDRPQVRDAWRGGLLGVHWLVEIPLPKGATLNNLLVHVRYIDMRTGKVLNATRSIRALNS